MKHALPGILPGRALFLAVTALLLAACSSLQPITLPEETTPAPASAALWNDLNAIHDGNWFALLNEGPTALDWRLRAIDSATASIDMQTFLWNLDTSGRLVFQHLIDAADRGIVVKLLVDDTFLLGQDQLLVEIADHDNIEYRVFNPYKRRASGFITRQALNLAEFHRLDHRMHNKSLIIDNQVAIVGGRNIADEYFGLHKKANFRDLELLTGGPIVQTLSESFDSYWNDPWSFPISAVAHVESSPLNIDAIMRLESDSALYEEEDGAMLTKRWRQLVAAAYKGQPELFVDNPPQDNPALVTEAPVQAAEALLELLAQAEDEIIIVSAYLIPTERLEAALAAATRRGVKVRILTNSIRSNNHLTAHSAYRNHIKALLDQGVELHEVRVDASDRGRYMWGATEQRHLALHAKLLVIDSDRIFVGSANLDPRSLRLNTEMGLLVESSALNTELRQLILPDFSRANAWQLQVNSKGNVQWVSDKLVRNTQPAGSLWQRIEDWFFAHLPIEQAL